MLFGFSVLIKFTTYLYLLLGSFVRHGLVRTLAFALIPMERSSDFDMPERSSIDHTHAQIRQKILRFHDVAGNRGSKQGFYCSNWLIGYCKYGVVASVESSRK